MTFRTRILAVCAAAVLAVSSLAACGTYHDTYHDSCNPETTANCAGPQD
jgi:hypothetical protein